MAKQHTLLFIVEQGGYAIHAERFTQAGHRVVVESSMRKALVSLKSLHPAVIVAEFNYGPKYGDRISNLEPLLAKVQSGHAEAKVIVLTDKEVLHHLERLQTRLPIFEILFYPLQAPQFIASIERALAAAQS